MSPAAPIQKILELVSQAGVVLVLAYLLSFLVLDRPGPSCDCSECWKEIAIGQGARIQRQAQSIEGGSGATTLVIPDKSNDAQSSYLAEVTGKSDPAEVASLIRSLGKTIVFVTASVGYLDFLENWRISVAKQGFGDQILFIAEDRPAFEYLSRVYPGHTVFYQDVLPAEAAQEEVEAGQDMGAFHFNSEQYMKLVDRRPLYFLYFLSLNVTVLYNDVDLVWVSNPFVYFGDVSSYDMLMTDDSPDDRGDAINPSNDLPVDPIRFERNLSNVKQTFPDPDYYMCTCFMFVRPTDGSRLLVNAWVDKINKLDRPGNQASFNYAYKDLLGQVKIGNLPQRRFPSGGVLFRKFNSLKSAAQGGVIPAVAHTNWAVGPGKKLQRLKQFDLWRVHEGHQLYKWMEDHKQTQKENRGR